MKLGSHHNKAIPIETTMTDKSERGSGNANPKFRNNDYVRESKESIQSDVVWKSAFFGEV